MADADGMSKGRLPSSGSRPSHVPFFPSRSLGCPRLPKCHALGRPFLVEVRTSDGGIASWLAVGHLRGESIARRRVRMCEPTCMDGAAQVEVTETHEVLAVAADIASGLIVLRV